MKATNLNSCVMLLMIVVSISTYAQTPVSEHDLPEVKSENIANVSNEEIITLLNTGLKPRGVETNKPKRLDVLVLSGKFIQGKVASIKLETLGLKVDSAITNTIVRTMHKDYAGLLSKNDRTVDHEFAFTFNYDFGRNQLSDYMRISTFPPRKD